MRHWLTVSNEEVSLDKDELPMDTDLDEAAGEITAAVDESNDNIEVAEALEAYADLVSSVKSRNQVIDPMLAQAIYIGLEGYGYSIAAMPSVESYGPLGVSVELLDKLKDGAKYVKEQVIALYKKIKELINRFFNLFRSKEEVIDEKLEELKQELDDYVEPEAAVSAPDEMTEAEIERAVKEASTASAKYKATQNTRASRMSEEEVNSGESEMEHTGGGTGLVVAGAAVSHIHIRNVDLINFKGKSVVFKPKLFQGIFADMDIGISDFLDHVDHVIDEYFTEKMDAQAACKRLDGWMRRLDAFQAVIENFNPGRMAPDHTEGFGFDSYCIQIILNTLYTDSRFIGEAMSSTTLSTSVRRRKDAYFRPVEKATIDEVMRVITKLSETPKDLFKESTVLEKLKGSNDATAIKKMNFINNNRVQLQTQYLAYRARVIEQIVGACKQAIKQGGK